MLLKHEQICRMGRYPNNAPLETFRVNDQLSIANARTWVNGVSVSMDDIDVVQDIG